MLPYVITNRQSWDTNPFANQLDDSISGLVIDGVAGSSTTSTGAAVSTPYVVGTSIQVYSVSQMESQYGIKTSTHPELTHHAREYFRMGGKKLWLMVAPSGTTYNAMLSPTGVYAKKLLTDASGEIKQIGIASVTPVVGTTGPNITSTGVDIATAQLLANSEYADFRPVFVLLEGGGAGGAASSFVDLRSQNARDVGVCIGVDIAVTTQVAPNGPYSSNRSADIGTCMGTIASARVHESIGWVQKFDLTKRPRCGVANPFPLLPTYGRAYSNPGISTGVAVSNYTRADQDILHDKGYIFARTHAGYPGVYWSNSPTCNSTDSYSSIERVRTMAKAIRVTRITLLPFLLSPLYLENGRLVKRQARSFEGLVQQAILANMSDSISKIAFVRVDPATDENGVPYPLLSTDNTLRVIVGLVPVGKAEQIVVSMGFTAQLN